MEHVEHRATARPPGAWRPGAIVLAVTLLAVLAALAAFVTRSAGGSLYLLVYAGAMVPGVPVGRRLFGRHPMALAAGGVTGYGLTSVAAWAVVKSGHPSAAAFLAAWAALSASTLLCCRFRRVEGSPGLLPLPAWRRRDTAVLLCVLALVAALIAIPYRNVGATDAGGNRLYRAYFTADFWWHMALTSELSRFEMPPVNPYLAPERMHYYWTYFMVPAAAVATGPQSLSSPEVVLKINALCTALLFTSMIFGLAWCALRRAWPLAAGVSLALFAPSAEGLYALWRIFERGQPLEAVRRLNIDAVTAWTFHGVRIDSLLRAMWYNPQHSTSITLALVALVAAGAGGSSAGPGTVLLAGLALGLSATMNPFLGAVFSAVYGVVILADAMRAPRELPRRVLRQALAAVPVVMALGWCIANDMVEGASGALRIDTAGPAWNAPAASLFLSLGPVLLPALLGLWPLWRLARPCWPAVAGVATAVGLMYFVWMTVEPYWIGFRSGQIFLATVPALIGRFFEQLGLASRARRWLPIAAFSLFLLAGLPTTVVDVFNAQDVTNRAMGPGFRWTIPISPDQQAAMDWIRRATPPDAIVQLEPVGRGRDTWSLIASLGQRRMAAGVPLPLMATPEYDRRMKEVRGIYATADAAAAWREARRLGIDYLYMDGVERVAYGGPAFEKFAASPEYFAPAFSRGEVVIYAVGQ